MFRCATAAFLALPHFTFWFLVPCSIKENLQNNALTPAELLRYFKQPVEGTRAAARAADYLQTTLSLLKERLRGALRGDFNVTGRVSFAGRKAQGLVTGAWKEGKGVVMGCGKSLPCGCSEAQVSYFFVLFFHLQYYLGVFQLGKAFCALPWFFLLYRGSCPNGSKFGGLWWIFLCLSRE